MATARRRPRPGRAGTTDGLVVGGNEAAARASRPARVDAHLGTGQATKGRRAARRRPRPGRRTLAPMPAMRSPRLTRGALAGTPGGAGWSGQKAWWRYTIVLPGSATSTRIVATIMRQPPLIFGRLSGF